MKSQGILFQTKSGHPEEHKGVICDLTYKVPYVTAKMIFTQSFS